MQGGLTIDSVILIALHEEHLVAHCLAEGHFDMLTAGSRFDLGTYYLNTLSLEPQPPSKLKGKIQRQPISKMKELHFTDLFFQSLSRVHDHW